MSEVRNYAIINMTTGIVENVALWDGETPWAPPEGYDAIQSDTAWIGWRYADGAFTAPPEPEVPPPTDEEVSVANIAKLQSSAQLASAQKAGLSERVGTLQDAIELDMATPEEVVELPVRQSQLLEWKRYAVYLGRVTSQEGWPPEVDWPVQPTEGMDLTVSATVPEQM